MGVGEPDKLPNVPASRCRRDENVNRLRASRDLLVRELHADQVRRRPVRGGDASLVGDPTTKDNRVLPIDGDSEFMDIAHRIVYWRPHEKTAVTDVDQRDGNVVRTDLSVNRLHNFHARSAPLARKRGRGDIRDVFVSPHAHVIGCVSADCCRETS